MHTSPDLRQVSDLTEMADAIRDQALAEANRSSGKRPNGTGRAGVIELSACLRQFSRGLATGIAKVLAANDQRVAAVYDYQPARPATSEQQPEHSPAIAIHLLIVVTAPSAALLALVASLTRALAASLWASPVFLSSARDLLVDANVITEQELRIGVGLAGLLSAVPAPSVKLWERETEVLAK
jgi:hypothetical protein